MEQKSRESLKEFDEVYRVDGGNEGCGDREESSEARRPFSVSGVTFSPDATGEEPDGSKEDFNDQWNENGQAHGDGDGDGEAAEAPMHPRRSVRQRRHTSLTLGTYLNQQGGGAAQDLGGLHAWTIARATDGRHERSLWSTIWPLLVLYVTMLVQSFVMITIAFESSHPACTRHDECQLGEFCAPNWITGNIHPGRCFDCYPNPVTNEAHALLAAHGEDYANGTLAHCAENDEMPASCDHLVLGLQRSTAATTIVLIFVAMLLALEALIDMDQQAQDQRLFSFRRSRISSSSETPLPWAVCTLVWLNSMFKLFVLTPVVTSAVIGLILTEPITSQALLLNGLAITFANQIDKLLANFFLSPSTLKVLNDAIEGMMVLEEAAETGTQLVGASSLADLTRNCPKSLRLWMFNRAYALVLMIIVPVAVLKAEALMSYGLIFSDGSGPMCHNIVDLALRFPIFVTSCSVLPLFYVVFCQKRWRPGHDIVSQCVCWRQQQWILHCLHCLAAAAFDGILLLACIVPVYFSQQLMTV